MSDVTIRVPRGAVGQNVLRRTVRALCAQTPLPLDCVDDLILICDELLARSPDDQTFTFSTNGDTIQVSLEGMDIGPVVSALASEVTTVAGRVTVTLRPPSH